MSSKAAHTIRFDIDLLRAVEDHRVTLLQREGRLPSRNATIVALVREGLAASDKRGASRP